MDLAGFGGPAAAVLFGSNPARLQPNGVTHYRAGHAAHMDLLGSGFDRLRTSEIAISSTSTVRPLNVAAARSCSVICRRTCPPRTSTSELGALPGDSPWTETITTPS